MDITLWNFQKGDDLVIGETHHVPYQKDDSSEDNSNMPNCVCQE